MLNEEYEMYIEIEDIECNNDSSIITTEYKKYDNMQILINNIEDVRIAGVLLAQFGDVGGFLEDEYIKRVETLKCNLIAFYQ